MRLKRASGAAIVLVAICLIIQLIGDAIGLWTTIIRVQQDLDSVYLFLSILHVVAGFVQIAVLLIIFGVLAGTPEQLICPCPTYSTDDTLADLQPDECHLRLRQTAATANVLISVSLAIVILSNLIYLGRLLPYLGQGFWSYYALCALLSLLGGVLTVIAILIVFKSLARNTEQLIHDKPYEPPFVDATAGGDYSKLRVGAIVAILLVLLSLIMGLTIRAIELLELAGRGEGQIDATYLLIMIMGTIGGLMMDASLLMVFVSLLRIKEPGKG